MVILPRSEIGYVLVSFNSVIPAGPAGPCGPGIILAGQYFFYDYLSGSMIFFINKKSFLLLEFNYLFLILSIITYRDPSIIEVYDLSNS